jgi:outer membrane protein
MPKRFLLQCFLSLAVAFSLVQSALAADTIGYVDYQKLITSYSKAQLFNDDTKSKEAELEKTRADYTKQIREAKPKQSNSPISVEQLQKKLEADWNEKMNAYRTQRMNQVKVLESEMDTTIQGVAKAKSLSVILSKEVVFVGGSDITNDVLAKLNKPAN